MALEKYVKLQCTKCKNITYHVHKNKKKVERKLALQKFCKYCRKHVEHKEGKR